MIQLALLLALQAGLLERADQAFRQGDLQTASTLARQAVERDPAAVHAHMILGVIAARGNEWEAANRSFLSVIKLSPSDPNAYFYLGQAKLYQRQWAGAIQYFEQAMRRKYPDPQRLLVELAMARMESGQPRQALADLDRAGVPAEPRLAAQHKAVTAFARARMGEWNVAIEAIRAALRLDDTNVHSWDFLIDALIKTDQAPQALAEAIKAQRKFPDHGDTQYLFALASDQVVESPLGGIALRNLREAEPDSPRVALAEGLWLRRQGKTEEATAAFQKAAKRNAPDAHLLLGILSKENGDYTTAEREYREALRLNPQSGQALMELGKLLAGRGDLVEARIRLEKAVAALPDSPTGHYQLGLVYKRLGLTEKADAELAKSRVAEPKQ
jgi:tetratricopeptide (TPR) repeat protein